MSYNRNKEHYGHLRVSAVFTETFRCSHDFLFRNFIFQLLLFSHINHVNNCSIPLFFLCLHSSSSRSEMKNKKTLNPTTTPMTRGKDEPAETEEHKHAELLVSDILYDITNVN